MERMAAAEREALASGISPESRLYIDSGRDSKIVDN
jgi:hypothetical protein